jgi:3-phosphoshikimate 1-carboxyvinyltransferase
MTDSITLKPVTQPIRACIRPPGSKSITNRALVCAALAEGRSTLHGALRSEDTDVMITSLRALGIEIESRDEASENDQTLFVSGCSGKLPKADVDLFVANSGTTMRFLTALATLGNGEIRLDGIARMRERPVRDLVDALEQLGAKICYEGNDGCPPVVVSGAELAGGETRIKGNISSQFLSGLLMTAPCARDTVTVEVDGPLVSVPYVRMTLQVMRAFGCPISATEDFLTIHVPQNSVFRATEYEIEPDASAASYFFAAAAITDGEVTVEGLGQDSLQGDIAFCKCLAQMGCDVRYDDKKIIVSGNPLRAIDVDMNAISDTVQTLAVVALFAEGATRIRNVEHIRHKETDRIGDLATELRKLGASVREHTDGLEITPPKKGGRSHLPEQPGECFAQMTPDPFSTQWHGTTIETYNDHRMAMSFALAGLKIRGVVISNPRCTDKTYPRFFSDLQRIVGPTD